MLRTFGLAFMEVVAPSARFWYGAPLQQMKLLILPTLSTHTLKTLKLLNKLHAVYTEKPFTHVSTAGISLACTPLV